MNTTTAMITTPARVARLVIGVYLAAAILYAGMALTTTPAAGWIAVACLAAAGAMTRTIHRGPDGHRSASVVSVAAIGTLGAAAIGIVAGIAL